MLIINNLSKKYRNGRGIQGIDLELEKGEIYGLIGANGAGKTTLLKVLAGLSRQDQGNCYIDDEGLRLSEKSYKTKVFGMIGDTVFYDYLTPMDHFRLVEAGRPFLTEEDKDRVLCEIGLKSYKDETVKKFSTGMRQRLAYGMCLLAKPNILLLDEPFSGLDIEGKLMIRDSLMRLRKEKETAVIISSHLIYDLEEIITRVGIMEDGRVIAEESMGDLMKKHDNLLSCFLYHTNRKGEIAG